MAVYAILFPCVPGNLALSTISLREKSTVAITLGSPVPALIASASAVITEFSVSVANTLYVYCAELIVMVTISVA